MKAILKKWALTLLPEPLLQQLRKRHYVQKLHNATRDFEPDLQVLPLLASPGDTVLDIGANFGLYSRFLSARVGSGGKVMAFEPLPPMAEVLRNNVQKLGLSNVEVRQQALSDSLGLVSMSVPQYEGGGDNFYEAQIISDREGDFKVETNTLDHLFEQEGVRPSFLKIDVEGHEEEVVRGGMKMLHALRPKLFIEVNGNPDEVGSAAEAFFLLMEELEYVPYIRVGRALKKREPGEGGPNYIFLVEEQ